MAIVSQSAFARLAGISRSAVSKSVKLGRLIASEGGMDTEHPLNAVYIKQARTMTKTGGRPAMGGHNPDAPLLSPSPPREKRGAKPGRTDEEYDAIADAAAKGKELDNSIKMVKLSKEKLSYYEMIRRSIPFEVVAKAMARMGAVMDEHFRMFDQRVGDQLYESVQSGKSKEEFNQAIRDEIDRSMKSILKTVSRELEGLRVQP